MHVSKTNKKYLNFLQDFHEHCNSGIPFVARDLIKHHNVATTVTSIMANGGLIKSPGRGRKSAYVWNTKNPDIRMVVELRKRMTDNHRKYLSSRNKPTPINTMAVESKPILKLEKPKSTKTTKTVKAKRKYVKSPVIAPKTRSINILWGAFKINY